jgi:hypothetical protein
MVESKDNGHGRNREQGDPNHDQRQCPAEQLEGLWGDAKNPAGSNKDHKEDGEGVEILAQLSVSDAGIDSPG